MAHTPDEGVARDLYVWVNRRPDPHVNPLVRTARSRHSFHCLSSPRRRPLMNRTSLSTALALALVTGLALNAGPGPAQR